MSSRLKILTICMAVILVVLGAVSAYGYYTGKFTSSADELAKAKQLDADAKTARYSSCSNGVCVGIDDYLGEVRPGQKISINAWITVPAGKAFKLVYRLGAGKYGYFSTYVEVGNKGYSPTYGYEMTFPDGRTDFNMFITIPSNPSAPNIFESVYLGGQLIDSNAFGYSNFGYGYGYNNNPGIFLYASHQTTIKKPLPKPIALQPADNSNNVPVNTPITAEFDSPLTPAVVSFNVFGNKLPITGTLSYQNDNKKITFTPTNNLANNTYYSARVNTNTGSCGTGSGSGSGTGTSTGGGPGPVCGNYVDIANWAFVTAKTQPPVVKISYPVNGYTTTAANITVTGTVSDPDTAAPLVKVTVNKIQTLPLNSNGAFSQKINLVYGTNTITVIATDPDKNVTTKTISITRSKPVWCVFNWMCR